MRFYHRPEYPSKFIGYYLLSRRQLKCLGCKPGNGSNTHFSAQRCHGMHNDQTPDRLLEFAHVGLFGFGEFAAKRQIANRLSLLAKLPTLLALDGCNPLVDGGDFPLKLGNDRTIATLLCGGQFTAILIQLIVELLQLLLQIHSVTLQNPGTLRMDGLVAVNVPDRSITATQAQVTGFFSREKQLC
jgi:hypothetical protein